MKRYSTTTKALVTISFSADDDDKQAEETFQKIVKHLRENVISHELDDVRVEIDSEGWHTQFVI